MVNLKRYHIKRSGGAELHPEETLADAASPHTSVETPIGPGVFRFFYLGALVLAGLLLLQSWQLQIKDGQRDRLALQRAASARWLGPAWRGLIYDAAGRPLVENLPVFDLVAVHNTLPAGPLLAGLINQLAPLVQRPAEELARDFAANQTAASFLIKSDLDKVTVTKLAVAKLPGLYLLANARRHYPAGPALADVLGYTAKVNPDDLKQDDYYRLTDRVGRLGLEQSYETVLRGEHRSFDPHAGTVANYAAATASGHDLYLTLDREIQTQLYRIMTNVLAGAGLKRGAAVVQNPQSGAVLGLVSLPGFDNNLFETVDPDRATVAKLLADRNQPLFNRAISGRYSPGSTIKPLLAMAGLKEGVVMPQTALNATGSISVRSIYDPKVVYTFKDWKVHGWTDLKKAIADSVDVYFYALGGGYGAIKGLGIDRLVSYLKGAGADQRLGLDLPGETSGLVPSPEWKKQTAGVDWFIGDTYNLSIGQGDLTVTPLWLNAYVGAIANGGQIMKPYLVSRVMDPTAPERPTATVQPQSLRQLPFDVTTLQTVRAGMRQAVTNGTAALLDDLPQPVAAKTGTAQVSGRKLNSLFIAYGPYDNPTVTMTVLVEQVQGQGLAIRVAHDFLAWYFNYQQLH